MDHEGYGNSTITQRNSDVRCGIEDLQSLMPVIEAQTGRKRILIYGLSSGGLRAGAFAGSHPQAVERLALDAFVWPGQALDRAPVEVDAALARLQAQEREAEHGFPVS